MLLKEHHVLFKVTFVFFHVLRNLFLVFGRVKNFVLHFSLLLVSLNFSGGLEHILKFSANKEFAINGAKKLSLVLIIEVGLDFFDGFRHFLDDMLEVPSFLGGGVVLRVSFLDGFLEFGDFVFVVLVEFGDFGELFLDGDNVFGGFLFLVFEEVNLSIKTAHEVVVDLLVLGEDFVLLEVPSESFLLFVGEEFELSKLNFEILFDIKKLLFFLSTEVDFLDEVVFLLLKEILSGVVSF